MNRLVGDLAALIAGLAGAMGMVLAPGWWKIAGILFPPYPWYLATERAMQAWGLLACG